METVVKYLVLPSSVMTLSALAIVVLVPFRAARNWALGSGLLGLSIYVLFGAGPVSFLLLGSLEFRIPPAGPGERAQAGTIVVLAGYAELDPDHPLSSRVNSTSAIRLLETVILCKGRPDADVIVSGSGDVAQIMRDVIVSAGVPAGRVIVDSVSTSTYESARNIVPRLGQAPFLLVTSAGHMPRSMGVFLKAGAHPLPVPTDYMTKRNPLATNYVPSPVYLHYSDLAISEYVALLWYRFNGWL